MIVFSKPAEIRRWVRKAQGRGQTVAVVPTMGALHEGHLSLVREAQRFCDLVVTTIFVNPLQFGPKEDFSKYPRPLERDAELLKGLKVDALFAPEVETMYPPGNQTVVEVSELTREWEGEIRPTHFRGVTTIVLKLFQAIPADVACFGQKDYQQAAVIQRMVKDLDVATRIEVLPTVREVDGLAMSSRNVYLSADERRRAASLSAGLRLAEGAFQQGERNANVLGQIVRARILEGQPTSIDYVAVVDRETLKPLSVIDKDGVILIAARFGPTRLIDNLILEAG